ncbi:MAG: methyltransferase domain-containing protein [Shimia sp.]
MKSEPTDFEPLTHVRICPACGERSVTHESDYPSKVMPFANQIVLYCSACGTGHVYDSAPLLEGYYTVDYATKNRSDRGVSPKVYFTEAHRAKTRSIQNYYTRAQSQIELLCAHGGKLEHVLDYGSGPGYFLHSSKARHKYAYEPDELSRKYLDYLGVAQFRTLEELPKNRFDCIVASHSIEHLVPEELDETLVTLMHGLVPGGRFLIEVPQGGHSFLHLAGSRQDPHTLFFTPEGLHRAVARAGQEAGCEILFAKALAKPRIPRRKEAVYTPSNDPFFNANRGRLTVICGKPA